MLDRLVKVRNQLRTQYPVATIWLIFMLVDGGNLLMQLAAHRNGRDLVSRFISQGIIITVGACLIWVWINRKGGRIYLVDNMVKGIAQHPIITVWFVFMIGNSIPSLIQWSIDGFIFQEAVVTVAMYLMWVWVNRRKLPRNKFSISALMLLFGILLVGIALHVIAGKYVILTYLIAGCCWLGSFSLAVKEIRKNSNV